MLVSATVMAKCVPENIGVVCPHEIPQALRMNLNTLLRHDVFSVEQLSSTVSEAGTNFTSDKRLGQSFYNMIRRDRRFGMHYVSKYCATRCVQCRTVVLNCF
jgi:hypothetical protein